MMIVCCVLQIFGENPDELKIWMTQFKEIMRIPYPIPIGNPLTLDETEKPKYMVDLNRTINL